MTARTAAPSSARNQSRGHASHRVAEQDRRRQFERSDECNDIVGIVAVRIPMQRRARFSVTSGVRRHYVALAFQGARQGTPASSAARQSMEQNRRRLVSACSQIMNVDAVCCAKSMSPVCHWGFDLSLNNLEVRGSFYAALRHARACPGHPRGPTEREFVACSDIVRGKSDTALARGRRGCPGQARA